MPPLCECRGLADGLKSESGCFAHLVGPNMLREWRSEVKLSAVCGAGAKERVKLRRALNLVARRRSSHPLHDPLDPTHEASRTHTHSSVQAEARLAHRILCAQQRSQEGKRQTPSSRHSARDHVLLGAFTSPAHRFAGPLCSSLTPYTLQKTLTHKIQLHPSYFGPSLSEYR